MVVQDLDWLKKDSVNDLMKHASSGRLTVKQVSWPHETARIVLDNYRASRIGGRGRFGVATVRAGDRGNRPADPRPGGAGGLRHRHRGADRDAAARAAQFRPVDGTQGR